MRFDARTDDRPTATAPLAHTAGDARMTESIAIVGGDAAGMSAASVIARSGEDAHVTVFERSGVNSYAACGLPYHVSRDIPDPSTLLVREPSYFTSKGIDLRLRHEVVDLDTSASAVRVLDRCELDVLRASLRQAPARHGCERDRATRQGRRCGQRVQHPALRRLHRPRAVHRAARADDAAPWSGRATWVWR